MDKLISDDVITQRRRKVYYILFIATILVLAAIFALRFLVKSSVHRSEITTSVVEIGSIENTISASGEILPEFEQVITSPINSSIQSVLINAGSSIRINTPILTLDKAASQVEYEKQKFQLESKRNSIHKLRLELEKSFYDLTSNNEIKQLKINSLKAAVEDTKRLYKAGGATKEALAQTELDLKVAQLEKKQLENEIRNKQETMKAEMRESNLAAAIQENDVKELERKLNKADILSNRGGVVTWVNRNIGSAVREGEVLARVADLTSFKVSGTIGDSYLDQLHKGMLTIVRINDIQLYGKVNNISPSVQNGLISFEIQLEDRNNKAFRPNMKVDVYLVTERKEKVLRVANGPAFKGNGIQEIFIVRNDVAERKTIHTGLSNFDYIEIKDHVQPGDVLITSDMSDYRNSKQLKIKN